ncbi:MAG TPA: flavodoxin, partial [Pelotomaculum sp.]|nr:flavodoxin [Pelotomaculum sp.]
MKKILVLAFTLIMALSLTACSDSNNSRVGSGDASGTQVETEGNSPNVAAPEGSGPQNTETESENQTQSDLAAENILIAYFSRTGNTREIASQIHERVGGDIFEIVPVDPYPTDYDTVVDQAKQELEQGYRPPLKTKVENMDSYQVVYLGYPNWWGTIPMAVATFLESYDFSGKTIVPFCTHEGSRLGRSVEDITELCPQSTILEGLAIRGSSVK